MPRTTENGGSDIVEGSIEGQGSLQQHAGQQTGRHQSCVFA
jgi:hypothetical protein